MSLLGLSLFQQLALAVLGISFLGLVLALYKGWTSRRGGLISAAIWLAAAVAILWPGTTSKIAELLGIGRGADLVFYCAVLAMMLGFWMIYIRLRRVRRDITLLVRHLATREAQQDATDADRRADASEPRPQTPKNTPDTGGAGGQHDGNRP